MEIKVSGTPHSLISQINRMAPRERYDPTNDVINVSIYEIKIIPKKSRRVLILKSDNFPERVEEIVIDRVGDKFTVYAKVNGKIVNGDNVVLDMPEKTMTIEEFVKELLIGLGWAVLRFKIPVAPQNDP